MSAAYQERARLFHVVDVKLAECHRLQRGWRSWMPWNIVRVFRLLREIERDHNRIRTLLP